MYRRKKLKNKIESSEPWECGKDANEYNAILFKESRRYDYAESSLDYEGGDIDVVAVRALRPYPGTNQITKENKRRRGLRPDERIENINWEVSAASGQRF